MTYKDLSNFTYKELRFFTYADISLDKYELIAKAENQSIDLPEDIQKKLRSLCTELANHHPNQRCHDSDHLFDQSTRNSSQIRFL